MLARFKILARARSITLLVCLGILIIYLSLQGEQGHVVNITRDELYYYLSMGEYGSFQTYELRRLRPQPQLIAVQLPIELQKKVFTYSVPLDKSQLILSQPAGELRLKPGDVTRTVVQNNTLYAIDYNRGVSIYDITQRSFPVKIGEFSFFGIRDLVFFDQIAFAAAGKSGVYILDLSVPGQFQVLGHYDTGGTVETVYPVYFNLGEMKIQTSAENGQVQEQQMKLYLAFVADGEAGYVVLDFKTGDRVYREMTLVRAENTPGHVYDIDYGDSYLFLADGNGGIRIYDIFASGFDPTRPIFVNAIQTPGIAYQVVFHQGKLLIADGNGGMVIAGLQSQDSIQPQSLVIHSTTEFPSVVTSLSASKDVVLVGGRTGSYLVDISNSTHPVRKTYLETPGMASVSQILSVLFTPSLWTEKVTSSMLNMLKEILLGFLVLLLALLVFVSFILPGWSIHSVVYSLSTFSQFLWGRAGMAVLVEDGEIQTDPFLHDQNTRRPLIVDNASAGLVQDRNGGFKLVQPGTNLLEAGEALVKIMDLRPRTFIFGPADEDPFEPQMPDEDEILARHRARRRLETNAFTRDEIEIVPNIIVDFQVKSGPSSPAAPFGFQPEYVFQALRKEYAVDKNYMEGRQSGGLNRLPGELAVKAWREYVPLYSLESLFSPMEGFYSPGEQGRQYGLEFVIECVNRFLKQEFVAEVDQDGRLTGNQVFSEAFNELEQAGLEVSRVWILNPRINPAQADLFLKTRLEMWFSSLQEFRQQVEARYQEIEAESHQQALIEFTRSSIHTLAEGMNRYQDLPEEYLFLNKSLYLLLRGTRSLSRLTTAEKLQLDQLLVWLERDLE